MSTPTTRLRTALRLLDVNNENRVLCPPGPMLDGGYASDDETDRDSLQTPQNASHHLPPDFLVDPGSPQDDAQTFRTSIHSSRCHDSDDSPFTFDDVSGYHNGFRKQHSSGAPPLIASLDESPQTPNDNCENPMTLETQWRAAENIIASNMVSLNHDMGCDPFCRSFGASDSVLPPRCPSPQSIPSPKSCSPFRTTSHDTRTTLKSHHPTEPALSQPLSSGILGHFLGPSSTCEASAYSARFPPGHRLTESFVELYDLQDELGAGGYGLVMTAEVRETGDEVAVKFILKSKVPDDGWIDMPGIGRIPLEIFVLSQVEHDGIVKCLDVFQDNHFFYLVQELHGTPWISRKHSKSMKPTEGVLTPVTPSVAFTHVEPIIASPSTMESEPSGPSTPASSAPPVFTNPFDTSCSPLRPLIVAQHSDSLLAVPVPPRPRAGRRASHDLFECIEQSKYKRFPESIARYIFRQVVDAVKYLHDQGITHRDIKDENLVIDVDYKVKLIDFGSVVWTAKDEPRPFYTLFYGTPAYASSEILQKQSYQAEPAEIWTLGVLLSFLLTGVSPFLSDDDAIKGYTVFDRGSAKAASRRLSEDSLNLIKRCLHPDPERRADIAEVARHPWLR